MNYTIDTEWFDEGGYCQVYPIKNHQHMIFKEFRSKKKAQEALSYHKKLVKFDLAPKIYTGICRLEFAPEDEVYQPEPSDWGYVAECARTCKANSKISMQNIQYLVEEIYEKTGLKFWDCHWYNVGLVKRGQKNRVVCIDTGKESFSRVSNAWGLGDAGPKCCYCNKYQCKCSE